MSDERQPMRYFGFRLAAWLSELYRSTSHGSPWPNTFKHAQSEIHPVRVENVAERYTPCKINMEPTNHPFRMENDLLNLHDYVPCSSSRVYTLKILDDLFVSVLRGQAE